MGIGRKAAKHVQIRLSLQRGLDHQNKNEAACIEYKNCISLVEQGLPIKTQSKDACFIVTYEKPIPEYVLVHVSGIRVSA